MTKIPVVKLNNKSKSKIISKLSSDLGRQECDFG
jgi:hypothetical protein